MQNSLRLNNKRKWVKERETKREFKRRRLLKRGQFHQQEEALSVREGVTYLPDVDLQSRPATATAVIPPAPNVSDNDHYVFFDLETTGLGRDADITQLSAVTGAKELNLYVMPTKLITPQASQVTGLTVKDGQMFHNGATVHCVSLQYALCSFLELLESFDTKPVILGHNIERFDVPVLLNQLKSVSMLSAYTTAVSCCIDTLSVFKCVYSKKSSGLENYKQSTLVRKFLGKSYDAHNSLEDVKALRELHDSALKGKYSATDHAFVLDAATHRASLKELVDKKVISANICTKLARSGLGLNHLRMAHTRDENQGIQHLFSEVHGQKCRISSCKRICESVKLFLEPQSTGST